MPEEAWKYRHRESNHIGSRLAPMYTHANAMRYVWTAPMATAIGVEADSAFNRIAGN